MQIDCLEGTSGSPVVQSLWAGLTSYLDLVVQGVSQLSFESEDGNSETSLSTCSNAESLNIFPYPVWEFPVLQLVTIAPFSSDVISEKAPSSI